MAGIIPDSLTGGISWTNLSVVNASRPADPFQISCEYLALPSDCSARIMPDQINAMVSEMLNLAGCFNPDGTWNCEATNNLCANWTAYRTEAGSGTNLWNDMQAHLCANPEVTAANPTGVAFFYCEDGEIKAAPLDIPEPVDPVDPANIHVLHGRIRLNEDPGMIGNFNDRNLPFDEPANGFARGEIFIPNTSASTIPITFSIMLNVDMVENIANAQGRVNLRLYSDAGYTNEGANAHADVNNMGGGGTGREMNFNPMVIGTRDVPPGGLSLWWRLEGRSVPDNGYRATEMNARFVWWGSSSTTSDIVRIP